MNFHKILLLISLNCFNKIIYPELSDDDKNTFLVLVRKYIQNHFCHDIFYTKKALSSPYHLEINRKKFLLELMDSDIELKEVIFAKITKMDWLLDKIAYLESQEIMILREKIAYFVPTIL